MIRSGNRGDRKEDMRRRDVRPRLQLRAVAMAPFAFALAVAGCGVNSNGESVERRVSAVSSAEAPDGAHLLVLVRSDGGLFSVVSSTLVNEPMPKRRGETKRVGWSVRASAAGGVPLNSELMDDPRVLRGAFAEATTGQTTGVTLMRSGSVTFAIRVPITTTLVEFFEQPAPSSARSAAPPARLGAINL